MSGKNRLAEYLQFHLMAWCKLSDIKKTVEGVPDRTLRRWLAELVSKGSVERVGNNKGTRYRWLAPANESVHTIAQTQSSFNTSLFSDTQCFSDTSRQFLRRVQAPLYTRSPVTYSEQWLNDYIPNQTFYLTASQRTSLHQQGKRRGIQGQAGTYIQKIYNRLLIDLSYNSARLEGNTYTLADTEQLLLKGVSAGGKFNEERVMILNHKEAIRYVVQNTQTLMPNEETIRTLHYLLADGLVAPGMAGQIRDESIGISGTTYAPLDGKNRLSRLLTVVLEKACSIEDPFEQSFFLLGHIAYLQAFVDVNKRTSRLAAIIPLIAHDYVPQSFIDVNKTDYLAAMICFYEFNEVGPLAQLYCWSYLRACQYYDTAVEVVGFDEIAVLYRSQRRQMLANIVTSMMKKQQVIDYLKTQLPKDVKPNHIEKFKHDVMEELKYLDISRIAGLGITKIQLQNWLEIKEK